MSEIRNTDYWKKIPLFRNATEDEWYDWRWQVHHTIREIDTLARVIHLSEREYHDIGEVLKTFRMAITPYYASLMDPEKPLCPIRLQSVPRIDETHFLPAEQIDPLHEDIDSPVPGLTHRYPDRVLLLATNICAMNCRHCTRRRFVKKKDAHQPERLIDAAIDYIAKTPIVRDVLISGGDPFVMSTGRLERIIAKVRAIPTVEIIRIGTRVPVVMPMRVTDKLVTMLRKYQPIYVNTQFNHPREITADSRAACEKLADAGIPLGNQSVLLRDVNDCPVLMKKLVQELLMIRVRPYYLYQCDMSLGISHFRTTVSKGIEIIENLRGHTSGLAVPTFVIDAPGGGGKIPVMPDYLIASNEKRVILRNYEGVITAYDEPESYKENCGQCQLCRDEPQLNPSCGVARLLSGEERVLEPDNLERRRRYAESDAAQRLKPD